MARKIILLAAALVLCLGGCVRAAQDTPLEGLESTASRAPDAVSSQSASSEGQPTPLPEDFVPYQAPPFAGAVFDQDAAQGENGVLLDLSGVNQGYVAVSAVNESRMKFRVEQGEQVYNYDLPSDGTPTVYPLQCGDGDYTFFVLENTSGNNYARAYSAEAQVAMDDEFQPFLRPSQYVDYDEDSRCVKLAAELAATQSDELGVVEAVFNYICEHVTYDREKATTVKAGYLPNPDDTLAQGKGICFDYASLAAAMLRSQGIPTKMVFGNVQPKDLYHAWNMFYTQESGWVVVGYEVEKGTWSRLDLTFTANGADGDFIGDGSNYTDVYYY